MAELSVFDKYRLIFLVTEISGVMSTCLTVDIQPPVNGMACQPFKYSNITTIKLEFCSLACVSNQRCGAIIYDKTTGVCMLMHDPCFSLKPQFNHMYRSFKYACTKWVAKDGISSAYWYFETDTQQSYVSRKVHRGNVLIGKKTHHFYVIDPMDSSVVTSRIYECLMVEPHCSVTWVSYDPTRSQPLPKGALIGGILTDTNTPLYVARQNVSNIWVGGYYNPLNGKAWAEYLGATYSNTQIEVMVVNIF